MASYEDTLTSLMQRLVRLVGAPAAVAMARNIPHLAVDAEGQILDYDRKNPRNTVQLLLQQYQIAFGDTATMLAEQALNTVAVHADESAAPTADTPNAAPAAILVVDDHVLVREGLASLINPQPDMYVVGQAGSVREAIAMANLLRPDLILMDFSLPDGKGYEAARAILATLPTTKIVFLTVHDDDERLFAAIAAGASGYLLKSIRSTDLVSRLREALLGGVALSPSIGQRILAQFSRSAPVPAAKTPHVEELTEREVEVLRLIVNGHTNRQIAQALSLSVRTVEYHRANLTSKLGINERAELVRYASEHGLL